MNRADIKSKIEENNYLFDRIRNMTLLNSDAFLKIIGDRSRKLWELEQKVKMDEAEQEAKPTLDEKYSELILTVQRKFDGETRHETALRYIREAESFESQGHDVEEFYKA